MLPISLDIHLPLTLEITCWLPIKVFRAVLPNNINILGLMSIPPFTELARPFFVSLRKLRDKLENQFNIKLPYLSMGMSGDFEEAIEEGSTHVRVGTSIFGKR